jgi:hypothetical protein
LDETVVGFGGLTYTDWVLEADADEAAEVVREPRVDDAMASLADAVLDTAVVTADSLRMVFVVSATLVSWPDTSGAPVGAVPAKVAVPSSVTSCRRICLKATGRGEAWMMNWPTSGVVDGTPGSAESW